VNLMLTMLLGGLWHGASWTFVVWGGLHGAYLLVNHAWRAVVPRVEYRNSVIPALGRFAGRVITFLAVVVAWVFFRSSTFDGAARILRGMVMPWPRTCTVHCYQDLFDSFPTPPATLTHLGGLLL